MSETDYGSRKNPLTINLNSLLISMLFGLSVKAGKVKLEKKTKFLSDANMSTVECVP